MIYFYQGSLTSNSWSTLWCQESCRATHKEALHKQWNFQEECTVRVPISNPPCILPPTCLPDLSRSYTSKLESAALQSKGSNNPSCPQKKSWSLSSRWSLDISSLHPKSILCEDFFCKTNIPWVLAARWSRSKTFSLYWSARSEFLVTELDVLWVWFSKHIRTGRIRCGTFCFSFTGKGCLWVRGRLSSFWICASCSALFLASF